MTEKEIEVFMEQHLKTGVEKLISGELTEYKSKYHNPHVAIQEFSKHGFEKDHDRFDSNGWDYDNWNYVTKGDKTFCISGHGYGGGIEIGIDEE